MKRKCLYLIASLIWGMPGCIVTFKGFAAYVQQPESHLWWLFLITIGVLSGFFFMFRRIVNRYMTRISSLPEPASIWQTFPLRGWILLIFMMGLGVSLKHIPGIPSAFTASFYSGLGPMLIISAVKYLKGYFRN